MKFPFGVRGNKVAELEYEQALAAKALAHTLAEARMLPVRPERDASDDDAESFTPPRRPAPVPLKTDGMGHDPSLVGIIDPREDGAEKPNRAGIPIREHATRTAARRTAGCTSLHRDRGTSRATFSGC